MNKRVTTTIKDRPIRIRIRSTAAALASLVDWGIPTRAARQLLGRVMTIYGRIPGYALTRSRVQTLSGWWIPRSTFTICNDTQRKKKTYARKPSRSRS